MVKTNFLIVDDDPGICETLSYIFQESGHSVAIASRGREAIDKAKQTAFNAALIDIKLPDMEGVELIPLLKKIHPDIEVIMITAYASLETAIRALNDAVSAYITKPLHMDEVLPTVGKTLGRQRLIMENRRLLKEAQLELAERKQAEEKLREYSEQLEEKVEQRSEELKETHEQLIRKEKLAVLGQLTGEVGHELRNPLGVISNAIYYLQTTLSHADKTTRDYLGMISSEVCNAEKIISNFLDFSRTRPAEREEIEVGELIAQVLEKRPPPENVKISTEIPSDVPPLFVDPQQIGQVLFNLVTNAYQAMTSSNSVETPEGGRLIVRAQAEKDKVSLSITDTGCGISKEDMKKVFEPLFTTKARGIGLGLAVSKDLVEVNGGSIEAESKEGEGSTFTVILPTKEVHS
jgi:signal transduction histidine kinase